MWTVKHTEVHTIGNALKGFRIPSWILKILVVQPRCMLRGYVAITVSLDSVHSQHVFSTLLPLCWLQINSLTPYLVLFQAVLFFWFSEKLFLGCSTFSSEEGTPFYICLWHVMYQLKYSWIKISPKILPLFIKCEWLSMNIVLPWMYTSKFRTKETTRHFFRRW